MADVFTPLLDMVIPEVGSSPDTWGDKLNGNMTILDSAIPWLSPIGRIVMWAGSQVPEGWALCDGTNGTPDLRDRFIVGSGAGRVPGDTGGANSVALTEAEIPAHSHSVNVADGDGGHTHTGSASSAGSHTHSGRTNTTGSHTHTYTSWGSGSTVNSNSGNNGSWRNNTTVNTGSAGAHTHSLSINSNGSHTHSFTTGSAGDHAHTVVAEMAGGGNAHENRPAYYALAFIMLVEA